METTNNILGKQNWALSLELSKLSIDRTYGAPEEEWKAAQERIEREYECQLEWSEDEGIMVATVL